MIPLASGLCVALTTQFLTSHNCIEGTDITKMSEAKSQEDINKEWNAMAGEWDDMASGYRNSFVKSLWEETGLEPGSERTVVDFGCGTGLLTASLHKSAPPSSKFVCIDAAPSMLRTVEDKILENGWESNVEAYCVALANLEASEETRAKLEGLKGKVDLVVASSVMSFVPKSDLPGTMKVLGGLLKPGGLFCHSDWPKAEDNEDGFSDETAAAMYEMGGLQVKSTKVKKFNKSSEMECDVFWGVATKP